MRYTKHKKVLREVLAIIEAERRESAKDVIKACDSLIRSMNKREKQGKMGRVVRKYCRRR